MLVLPLGVLATIAFAFLMWETRLVRRQALTTIRGRGTILATPPVAAFVDVDRVADRWTRPGVTPVMATATGMRNVVMVLYVARYCFPGTNVYMFPVAYLALMVPTNVLFHLAFSGWHKLRPPAEA